MRFRDRTVAGQLLAGKLLPYAGRQDVLVLALPRGGVPVAFEVAMALDAPLDVFLVRKLGLPGQEELAMGAIATGGVRVLNDDVVSASGVTKEVVERVTALEQQELERRERLYRGSRPAVDVGGRTVILVDDGLATGATMRAAVTALKQRRPAQIIVAVPVAARQTCDEFERTGDALCVCAVTPAPFDGVGRWYTDFSQTTDEEVHALLARAGQSAGARPALAQPRRDCPAQGVVNETKDGYNQRPGPQGAS
jgi:predicted phosphoribosyltransferase